MGNQQIKVEGTDTAFGDKFGASVSVSDNYVALSAPREDAGGATAGASYFFKCTTTTTTTLATGVQESDDRPATTPKLEDVRTKAISSNAGSRRWMASSLTVLFFFAAVH